ncbi:hypothetical protein [Halomonas heilongjiangensis]|uniref:hypothetical protein n=1 Tax=Halomonas heilongjiangensis TaxID=1387883 RepID=UPI0011AFAB93|nr:hypothetical protein [Halomonas heilongjiangensis]
MSIGNDVILEKIKRIIESKVPGAQVKEIADNGYLDISVVVQGVSPRNQYLMVARSIYEADVQGKHYDAKIKCFESHDHWVKSKVQEIITEAIKPVVAACGRFNTDVEVLLSGSHLEIVVTNWGIREGAVSNSIHKRINGVVDGIKKLSNVSYVSVRTSNGHPHFPQHLVYGDDDICDDFTVNPNWPSKTGNPSGKGRGNNPPGRGR